MPKPLVSHSLAATTHPLRAQGAAEYLVLLAAVLMIALVTVALLGFFPGFANESRITQSQAYWKSTTPISVTESMSINLDWMPDSAKPYIRVKNTGQNPIRITKLLGKNTYIDSVNTPDGLKLISDIFYLSPGEENYFAWTLSYGGMDPNQWRYFLASTASSCGGVSGGNNLCAATSVCEISPRMDGSYGTLEVPDFGFEYVEYVENMPITKKQAGASPLLIKCLKSAW